MLIFCHQRVSRVTFLCTRAVLSLFFVLRCVPSLSRGKSRLRTLRRHVPSTEKYVLADPRRHQRLTTSTKPGTRHYGDKQCLGPTGTVVPEVPITFCFVQSRCIDTDTRSYTFVHARTEFFFIPFSYISNIILLSFYLIRVRRVRIQGGPRIHFSWIVTSFANSLCKTNDKLTCLIPCHSVYP